jgi:predicted patatin/cPLA2 family phospholipase
MIKITTEPRTSALIFVLLSLCVAVISGCANLPERNPMNAELQKIATIPGIPHARTWGDTKPDHYEEWMSLTEQELRARYPESFGKPHNYLAISGGGARGAFGAGLLNGWTAAGTRPEFSRVTGVSTGAILAPFAFLGSEYDSLIKTFYTTLSTEDLIKKRSMIGAVMKDAATDSAPLKSQLAKYVTDELVAKIAAEYAQGRALIIGTTNLDAARSVNWNITAIASSGAPNATQLIRDIILASAAIPAAFPPVMFNVEANGQSYDELHVDGGVSSNVFVYPIGIDYVEVLERMEIKTKPNLYILRNGYLQDAWAAVKRNTLEIAGYSMSTMMTYVGHGDFNRMYLQAQRDGLNFNLIKIPADFEDTSTEPFDPVWMSQLFDLGYSMAVNGIEWEKVPPGYDTNVGE